MMCKRCGQRRAVVGGYCGTCYLQLKNPQAFCKVCHERLAVVDGMCRSCYQREYRKKKYAERKKGGRKLKKIPTKELTKSKIRRMMKPRDEESILNDEEFVKEYIEGEEKEE